MAFDKDKYQRAFEGQLDIVERRNIAKIKRYYRENYNKGIESFLSGNQTDFSFLFPVTELLRMYRDLYVDIGMQFAKWYPKNYDRLLQKNFDIEKFLDQWEVRFAAFGDAIAGKGLHW
jgi:hypothetical protein